MSVSNEDPAGQPVDIYVVRDDGKELILEVPYGRVYDVLEFVEPCNTEPLVAERNGTEIERMEVGDLCDGNAWRIDGRPDGPS